MAQRHNAHLSLVFVFSFLNHLCDAGNAVASPTLSELCPYNNYCTSNASMILESARNIPCCTQCSCEDDCWRRADCCPDKDNSKKIRPPTEICRDTIVRRFIDRNGRNDTETILGIEEIKRYYIIDTCPDKETSEAVVEKCSGESQELLEDFVWVTDSDTGRIYRNTFCAGCHGVTNFVLWDLSTDCIAVVNDASNFRSAKTLPNECRLLVSPSKYIKDASTKLCVFPSESKCNITGVWQTYDADIEEKCQAFESPYVKSNTFNAWVYRNVFCFLCNKDPLETKTDACPDFRRIFGRGLGDDFLVLLDHRALRENTDEKAKAERCAFEKVYEPIQNKCKTLFCPALQIANFGTCVNISIQTHLLGITVNYRLEPIWARSTTPTENGSIYYTKEVADEIIQKIQIPNTNCLCLEISVHVAHQQMVRSEIPVYYRVLSVYLRNQTCHEDLIMRMGKMDETIVVRIKDEGVMKLAVHFGEESTLDDAMIHGVWPSKVRVHHTVKFADLVMCPTLVFNNTEYIGIMEGIVGTRREDAVKSVFSNGDTSSSEAGESTISVCLDDYMAAVSNEFNEFNESVTQYYGIYVIVLCLVMVGAF